MKYIEFADLPSAEEYQDTVNKAMGWPAQGVDLQGNPKGSAVPGSPGWTMRQYDILKHPNQNKWAHPSFDIDTEGKPEKLTKEEKDYLKDLKKAEKDLTSDWFPAD